MSAEREVAAAYDRRAAEYVALVGAVEQLDPRDAATIAAWRDTTTGPLLDAGCGPGLWTRFLRDGGDGEPRDVTGVDLSGELLAAARELHPGVPFVQGSFLALPQESASLGGILAWYSVIHTPPAEVSAVLAEFARVLAPGGTLLLGFFAGEPREPFAHAVTTAYFWSTAALTPLLAAAGLTVSWSEVRGRSAGEVSARPHGALIARRD